MNPAIFGPVIIGLIISNAVSLVLVRRLHQRAYVFKWGYKEQWQQGKACEYLWFVKGEWTGDLHSSYRRAKRENEMALFKLKDPDPLPKMAEFGQWKEK